MDIIQKFSAFYTNLASMNIEDLPDLYEKNVIFIDPIDTHHGIDALENYFKRLLKNAKHCQFVIHSVNKIENKHAVVKWTMTYSTPRLNSGEPVNVEGVTWLETEGEKITLHRDYFDLGQMVYEHLPLLGYFVKKVKGKLG